MTVAVLALQGAFAEHIDILTSLGVNTLELRKHSDLDRHFDALILPGGESTAMGRLLCDLDMLLPLQQRICDGMPVFGTCAGMILLAKTLQNDSRTHLATMDITVMRNAYGRQLGSFDTTADFAEKPVAMTFIRAPFVSEHSEGVQVLSTVDGHIVAVRQGNQLATAFHPELTTDTAVHRYFLDLVGKAKS